MKDERIETTRNRIAAIGFCILYVLLWVSFCYRGMILQQPPREWWDIFAIWVIGLLFVFIAFANKGLFAGFKRAGLTIGIGVGTIVGLTLLFITGEIHSVLDAIVFSVGFLLGIGPVIGIAYFLTRRWKRKEGVDEEK